MVKLERVENIPAGQLQALGGLIQEGFQTAEEIEQVYEVMEGASHARHMAAKAKSGEVYGLKSSVRVANALEKEKLVGDLAILLQAPNASPVIQVPVLTFGVFKGDRVNITRWLRDGEKVAQVAPNELKDNSEMFFEEYGEWMLLALHFGVADRHSSNWVWNTERKQLAMIDTEDSFSGVVIGAFTWAIDLCSKKPSKFTREPEMFEDSICLREGLKRMDMKLRAHEAEIAKLLSGFEFAKKFHSPYVSREVNSILDEFIGRGRQ